MCGLTEPFLWIQLVAEGSAFRWRRLGVVITKARYNFVEGSLFGLRRAKGSVKSKEIFSLIERKIWYNQRIAPVQSFLLIASAFLFINDNWRFLCNNMG